MMSCFQYIKGTKKKANHNLKSSGIVRGWVVSNTSKVLKRKQITTEVGMEIKVPELFPIHQRY